MKYTKKIIAIYVAKIACLPTVRRTGNNTARIEGDVQWQKLNIEVPASLVISNKIEKKQRVFSAKLIFRTTAEYIENDRFVYRVIQADNRERLIGTDSRPFPICETQQNLSPSINDSPLLQVTISYTSTQEIAFIN